MKLKNIKSHFKFNKQERSGIFFLLFVIILLQCAYFLLGATSNGGDHTPFVVNEALQKEIDGLKKNQTITGSKKTYPFNPNFITDHKGYVLGMSVNEIDRLHAYRALGKYVGSAKEFQEVTHIPDSLLNKISPYFKFPVWPQEKGKSLGGKTVKVHKSGNGSSNEIENPKAKPRGLNAVTAKELRSIYGIGDKLSARIIKFRNRLGGFLIDEQLYDVYGLDSTVVEKALKKYRVTHPPAIKKININKATVEEISQLVYIQYAVAQKIVTLRENIGSINSFNQLGEIEGFPSDKIDRIKLYLAL